MHVRLKQDIQLNQTSRSVREKNNHVPRRLQAVRSTILPERETDRPFVIDFKRVTTEDQK